MQLRWIQARMYGFTSSTTFFILAFQLDLFMVRLYRIVFSVCTQAQCWRLLHFIRCSNYLLAATVKQYVLSSNFIIEFRGAQRSGCKYLARTPT